MAQKNPDAYYSETRLPATVFPEDERSLAKVKDLLKVSHGNKNNELITTKALNAKTSTSDSQAYHNRKTCSIYTCYKYYMFF